MPNPLLQLLLGLGIGLIGYLVFRTQPITMASDAEHSRRRRASTPNSKPEDNCSICLRRLDEEPMTYLNCSHALHDQCLRKLRNNSDLCPLCRAKL